jgi:hypothetical protein
VASDWLVGKTIESVFMGERDRRWAVIHLDARACTIWWKVVTYGQGRGGSIHLWVDGCVVGGMAGLPV